jgi:hypothetical protein
VLSVAEHAGWAHVVCVAPHGDIPAVVARRRVTLIDAGLPTQPYHHEAAAMTDDDANALIARVRRSIAARTSAALQQLVAELSPAHAVVTLAIRKPTFDDLPDTYAPVRESYRLFCAADGMMYQLAICRAARKQGLDVLSYSRSAETSLAANALGVKPPRSRRSSATLAAQPARRGRRSIGERSQQASPPLLRTCDGLSGSGER